MNIIYKYTFDIDDEINLSMPADAKILHVDVQHGSPTIWALVNPDYLNINRKFYIRGTGHDVSPLLSYIKTFYMGSFVWHLFQDSF